MMTIVALLVYCILLPHHQKRWDQLRLSEQVVSPPIYAIGDRHISLPLPYGWKVVSMDINPSNSKSMCVYRVRRKAYNKYIYQTIVISSLPIHMNEIMDADFRGRPLVMSGGLSGVKSESEMTDGSISSNVVIMDKTNYKGWAIISVTSRNLSVGERHNFETFVFSHLRYIK